MPDLEPEFMYQAGRPVSTRRLVGSAGFRVVWVGFRVWLGLFGSVPGCLCDTKP